MFFKLGEEPAVERSPTEDTSPSAMAALHLVTAVVGDTGAAVAPHLPGAGRTLSFFPLPSERSVAWASTEGFWQKSRLLGEIQDVQPPERLRICGVKERRKAEGTWERRRVSSERKGLAPDSWQVASPHGELVSCRDKVANPGKH